jgi:ABC-type arginine/histidine transport system permease subunit
MTINRIVRIVAGFFIMLSLALAHVSGQVDLSKLSWLWFTLFVGANLFQSGFTRFCPLDSILKMFGVPETESGRCS